MQFSMKNPGMFVKHVAIASVLAIIANFGISFVLGFAGGLGAFATAIRYLLIAGLIWWGKTFHRGAEDFVTSLVTVFSILAFVSFLNVFTPILSYGFTWSLEGVATGLAGLFIASGAAQRIKI